MGIFDGLEALGFELLKDKYKEDDLYKKEEKESKSTSATAHKLTPEECLYEKSIECPVCDNSFKDTIVIKRKLIYEGSDSDLKANYLPIDPIHYDVSMCPRCGYTAVKMFFNKILDRQKVNILTNVSSKFKRKDYPYVLTDEMAIERYKMALYNAMLKGSKSGEKGYICLKLAWLYRNLKDAQNEKMFITNAYKGLKEAYSSEDFPICGMDENTFVYLIAELARRVGEYTEALRWVSSLILKRDVPPRVKAKADMLKDMIREDANKEKEAQNAAAVAAAESQTAQKSTSSKNKP